MAVERGEDILIVNRSILRDFSESIGRTDDLPHFHPAPREQCAGRLRPVVATPGRVDPRCPAEFTPGNHADILIESPGVQVFDQGCDTQIKFVQLFGEPLEVSAMTIPASK